MDVCVCLSVYISMCLCLCVCRYLCVYVLVCVCVCVYLCVNGYVCVSGGGWIFCSALVQVGREHVLKHWALCVLTLYIAQALSTCGKRRVRREVNLEPDVESLCKQAEERSSGFYKALCSQ